MKKIIFLFSMLILNIYFVSGQWNPNGDNTTTGNLTIGSINSLITINGSTGQAFGSLGKLDFYNGNSNANIVAARIEGKRDSQTYKDGRLSFYTADDNGSLKERLIIDRHGRLRFNGSTGQAFGSLGKLDFYNGNSNANIVAARIEGKRDSQTYKDGRLSFYTADDSGVLQENMILSRKGNLAIKGKLEAEEIKVTLSPTADFVFEPDYNLPALSDIEIYIKENKHLPEIASANEMKENGLNISEFQIQLLQKIEELTLYMIEINKEVKTLRNENELLKKEINTLKTQL